MGRKLIQDEHATLLDPHSNAYTARYLEELLEREISRASRFNHDLAIIMLEIDGFEVLRGKYGEGGIGRILRELVAVVRAKTRKVNSLARIQDGKFCLVVPEADRGVAVTVAEKLRHALEEHPFMAAPGGEIVRLRINIGVAASPSGKEDKSAMLAQAEQGLEQARTERRVSGFRPSV
jgi:diguanylate cyclase (GGDEF)-like protein